MIKTAYLIIAITVIYNKKSEGVEVKAEYIIVTEWDKNSNSDIDTWVRMPQGEFLWFRNKQKLFAYLDHDDKGIRTDRTFINGKEVIVRQNRETIYFRKLVKGTYTVQTHFFRQQGTETGIRVKITMYRVRGFKKVAEYSTVMNKRRAEKTAFTFVVNEYGQIVKWDDNPVRFINDMLGDRF